MTQTIEDYLQALKAELRGSDAATAQDALADSEEHLRTAVAGLRESSPEISESDALAKAIEQYGSPSETAAAYAEVERRTVPGFGSRAARADTWIGRILSVYADPRTWGALLFMFITFVTGIIYFTWAVTGFSVALSLAIFIFGLPLALLFLLSVRGLALLEGRLVEGLLSVRMPRRPLFGPQGMKWFDRLKLLVTDKHTWLSFLYLLLQLPLGTLYFALAVTLISLALGFMAAPFAQVIWKIPLITFGMQKYYLSYWNLALLALGGFVLLTLTMHVVRGIGILHGRYAKAMLVTE